MIVIVRLMCSSFIVLAILFFAPTANASLLGETVRIERQVGSTVLLGATPVVGPGIEFVDTGSGDINIDINDTMITFGSSTFQAFGGAGGAFNGYFFADINGTIDDIVGVLITGQTGYTGFNASDISFDANSIHADFASVGDIRGGMVELTILFAPTTSDVPEPITATLGVIGLGVLGMATRRRYVR